MRYVMVLTSVFLAVTWAVLSQREPFRSHSGLTALGLVLAATLVAILFGLVQHWRRHKTDS